jgi:hypothetical protein
MINFMEIMKLREETEANRKELESLKKIAVQLNCANCKHNFNCLNSVVCLRWERDEK